MIDQDKEYRRQWYLKNKEKVKARVAEWRKANPDRVAEIRARYRERNRDKLREDNKQYNRSRPFAIRDNHLRRNFGITLEEYNRKLSDQRGVCAICSRPETRRSQHGRVHRLSVDHDHATGQIRGLLCTACNHSLGRFHEDSDLLRRAADYLDEWNGVCNNRWRGRKVGPA